MKSLSVARDLDQADKAFEEAFALAPSLLIFFAPPALFEGEHFREQLASKLSGCAVIGCSTAGEITNEGALQNKVALLAIHFDKVKLRTAVQPIPKPEDSFKMGEALATQLMQPDLKGVIVFTPGVGSNGSALAEGMSSVLGRKVHLSGGMAGDDLNFRRTFTFCDGQIYEDHAVAVGLYGDSVVISCGSEGGWRPFGPARRVTKAENNILYELDDKPALQLYKQYLGDKARQLPASGLSYPFAILRDDRTTSGVIRSALGIDQENEALILAGDLPQGCRVCLMHAETNALIQGAAQAAAEALRTHAGPETDGCALLVNCVGRRLVLGLDSDEEIEAVSDSFLPGTPLAGFYSYGEICTHPGTGRVELHNQTMTITYITERKES